MPFIDLTDLYRVAALLFYTAPHIFCFGNSFNIYIVYRSLIRQIASRHISQHRPFFYGLAAFYSFKHFNIGAKFHSNCHTPTHSRPNTTLTTQLNDTKVTSWSRALAFQFQGHRLNSLWEWSIHHKVSLIPKLGLTPWNLFLRKSGFKLQKLYLNDFTRRNNFRMKRSG